MLKKEQEYRIDPMYKAAVREKITTLDVFVADLDAPADLKLTRLMAVYRSELERLFSGRPDASEDIRTLMPGLLLSMEVWCQLKGINDNRPDIFAGYLPNRTPQTGAEQTVKMVYESWRQFETSIRNLELNLGLTMGSIDRSDITA